MGQQVYVNYLQNNAALDRGRNIQGEIMLRQLLRCTAVIATGLLLTSQAMAAGILRYATIG